MSDWKKNIRQWIHIVLSLTVLAICIGLFSVMNQQPLPESSLSINNTYTIYSDNEKIPPNQADWEYIPLPDDWFRTINTAQHKWYRFTLPTEIISTSLALYLTYTTRPVTLFINDQLYFKPEGKPNKIARTWGQPQLIRINIDELRNSNNKNFLPAELSIAIKLPANQSASGMLGEIYIGPEKILFEAYTQASFIKVELVKLLVFAMILSSLFVAMLWLFRRNDTIFAFYALAVLFWALYSYSHLPLQLPVSSPTWEWLRSSCMVLWSVSISLFCNRFLNSPQPYIEKPLVIQAIFIVVTLPFIDTQTLYWLADYFFPAYATALGLYPSYRMLNATLRQKDPYLTWLTMCGMMVMLLAAHDIAVMAHWIAPWQGLYLHYTALILLLVFNFILVKRFVTTLNEVENLNANLEQLIDKKTQELKANYEQLHQMALEKDLNKERERIMHDMHDGVGGSLVSMRAALDSGNWQAQDIHDGLGNALDDLYLMIHSLDPYGTDLTLALGSIRRTLENRLRRADIKLQWVIQDIPTIQGLSPEIVLSIMRIMQEAITNIIKHAKASEVIIRIPDLPDNKDTSVNQTAITVSITDNGCGIDPEEANQQLENPRHNGSTRYGLSGMQSRADKAGIKLTVQMSNPGTLIRLIIPTLFR